MNPGIKSSIGAKKIERRLAVVILVCLVDFRLSKDDKAGAMVVPLKLNLVTFEEVLLRGRCVEVGYVVYSHCRGLALVHVS